MVDELTNEINILLDKVIAINSDFRKRDYTKEGLLNYLRRVNASQEIYRFLEILDRLDVSVQHLKEDLNTIRDIQQRHRGVGNKSKPWGSV